MEPANGTQKGAKINADWLTRMHGWRGVLFLAPVLLALIIRLGMPSFFEYESQEDTVRAMTIIENGELPLYGIGHVRFLGAALGPLVYYFKAIPYAVSPSPWSEVFFLVGLHLVAMWFAMMLSSDLIEDAFKKRLPPWVGTLGGLTVGTLLALSVYANALTSHAHPSYFAAVFMVPFVYSMHRYIVHGEQGWLVPGGIAFGLMTQLYQLTLFAPLMLLVWLVVLRRKPTRGALLRFLLPVFVCYLPYIASELATGFWNTLNFFTYQPGPKDAGMVGTPLISNLLFMLNTAVDYRALGNACDGLFLALFGGGLYSLFRWMHRSRSLRFFGVFFLFYCVLPSALLQAPRFQLSLPAVQLLVVLGLCEMGWVGFSAVRDGPSRRVWASGIVAGFIAMGAFLFGGSEPDFALRRHLVYPLRIIYSEPAGRTPDLAQSIEVLGELRTRYGVDLEQLDRRVHSPVVRCGFYGHHYLMRMLSSTETKGPGSGHSELLVTDEYFPFAVDAANGSQVGGRTIAEIAPARFGAGQFRETISCDQPWCEQQPARSVERPWIRFFWGCGEFRDLDPRLSIPEAECEDLLEAPEHTRAYEGYVRIPEVTGNCDQCSEVVYVGVTTGCSLALQIDGQEVPLNWVGVRERKFGFAMLDRDGIGSPGRRDVKLVVGECRPYYLDMVFFAGQKRPGVEGDEYWSNTHSGSL